MNGKTPPAELREAYRKLLKRVAKKTNKALRDQWLENLPLPQALKKLLRWMWTPLSEDSYHGLALKFNSETDFRVLGKEKMRPELDALVTNNTVDAIMEKPKTQKEFLEPLLRDMLKNPKPYHKVTWK